MTTPLIDILREYSDRRFSYGTADCCAFAGAVVEVVHGYNPMDNFGYTNEHGAEAIIAKHGNLLLAVVSVLGKPDSITKETEFEEGDVVIVLQADGTWIVGVVVGNRIAVKTKTSLMDWPLHFAHYRWRP